MHATTAPEAQHTDIIIRLAGRRDRPSVEAMARRCSRAALAARFHAPRRDIPEPYLSEALRRSPLHHALVAKVDNTVVGLASACVTGGEVAELAVLVEDDHQNRGVGSLLLGDLAALSAWRGVRRFTALIGTDNTPIRRALNGLHGRGYTGHWTWRACPDGLEGTASTIPHPPFLAVGERSASSCLDLAGLVAA